MGAAPGQMDLLWRDNVESLLDSSVTDVGDAPSNGDGGGGTADTANVAGSLLWQATVFGFEEVSAAAHSSTLDSALNDVLDLVWTATGGSGQPPVTLPLAPENPFADGFPQSFSLGPPSGLLWTNTPDPMGSFSGETGQTPVLADPGNNVAATGVASAGMSLAAAEDFANGAGSLLWQATLFAFEEVSAAANSSTLDSTLNQVLDVVWTATGGSGQPPVTLPHAPENPFANGFSPFLGSLLPSQLVWTPETGSHGQPAVTGVLPGPTFAAPTTLVEQAITGVTQLSTLFGRS